MKQQRKTISPDELTRWIKTLVAENALHRFYICKPWRHLRAEVLRDQNDECQMCKASGKHAPAETVHHIKTVRRAPWLALTKANCVALCGNCHYKIHHPPHERAQLNAERW